MRTTAASAAPCSAAPNVRWPDTGAVDAGTTARGFANPMHALDAEDDEDAQDELDEQQENEDLTKAGASKN
eukprot:COSAG04_NODE_141_length_23595_cov_4.393003_20_plen_71_part_00